MSALLLLAVAAFASYVAAFAPLDFGWLAAIALTPWPALVRRLSGRRLFGFAYLIGAAIFTVGCFWLRKSHPLNLVLMVLPESLFFGLFALLLRRLQVVQQWPAWIALPLAFTSVEFARGRLPLDGFPWLSLGSTQHAHLGVLQFASVAGVHGLTFMLAMVAGALAHALERRRRGAVVGAFAAVALLGAAEWYGRTTLGTTADLPRGPRLLLLQANIEQQLKNRPPSLDVMIDAHVEVADRAAAASSCDLLVWPETMLPGLWRASDGPFPGEEQQLAQLRAVLADRIHERMTQRYGKPLLAGAVTLLAKEWLPTTPFLNSALLFDRDGRQVAAYDKRLRVPGGEYVPWIDAFPESVAAAIRRQIVAMAGGVPNLLAGERPGLVDLGSVGLATRVGLTICYEIAYPAPGRALVAEGADFLLNLSNEGWFPDSSEFDQYSAMAVVRAVEARRSLLRCANTGTSGWIDPWGRPSWLEQAGRRDGFAGSIVVAPPIATGLTLYVRFGDWLPWLSVALALLCSVARLPRRSTALHSAN